MATAQIIVTVFGLALSAFIAWFFWFAPKGRTQLTTLNEYWKNLNKTLADLGN